MTPSLFSGSLPWLNQALIMDAAGLLAQCFGGFVTCMAVSTILKGSSQGRERSLASLRQVTNKAVGAMLFVVDPLVCVMVALLMVIVLLVGAARNAP